MRVYYLYVTSVKVYEELSHILHVAELEVQDVPFEDVSTVAVPLSIEPVMIRNLLFP